jgi:probable F420-dependent oxidoreductase
MDLGRVGIWTFALDLQPVARAREVAAELEELGYGAIWVPDAVGRDPLVHAALLLGGTNIIAVGTGIAQIYGRDPMTMTGGWKTISEAFPGRFVLGLGVSHQPMVEGLRGQTYGPPLTAMREYLDRMDTAMYVAAEPTEPPRRTPTTCRRSTTRVPVRSSARRSCWRRSKPSCSRPIRSRRDGSGDSTWRSISTSRTT